MTPGEPKYPHLTRPPLREAVIDLGLQEQLPLDFTTRLQSLSLSGYDKVGEMKLGGFRFQLGLGQPSSASVTSDEVLGMRFQTPDGSQALQYRRNGFTFSVLKNYRAWEPFRQTAQELWGQFLQVSGPVIVSRIAVRYINAIDVPMGADFDEYLTASPRIPKDLPQLLTAFLQRIVIPFGGIGAYAIITQAFETPVGSSLTTIIDIDVIKESTFDGTAPGIWETLSQLRDVKNQIFFASVTNKALEAYR